MANRPKTSKNKNVLYASGLALLLLAGGYTAYDYYAGNHVEIEQVIPSAGQASPGQNASPASPSQGNSGQAAAADAVPADKLNGTWSTVDGSSKVYVSVTTSKETVNIAGDKVKGQWTVNVADPAQTKGQGEVEIASLNSGNNQRDNHIKSDDLLQAASHPKAAFAVTSFEGLPAAWKEGQVVPLKIKGSLTVKGITKDVVFDANALYEKAQLKLSGSTVVTFGDFGMKNPHTVVLAAENNLTVRMELVFGK
ncbi:YceI family protein [Paenibacillus hodogayensis]|uniref:YceI family protein n=1 Tax=Paenibacillus hodogayensis TaxID=279208 RepID=A0ABV5VTG2_9BACL